MTPTIATGPRRLASTLNAACQCVWLDRDRLDRQLAQGVDDAAGLLASRPGMVSGGVVFVDAQDTAAMDRTVRLVHAALSSPAYERRVAELAAPVAGPVRRAHGGILGLDFHLGGEHPS